MSCGSCGKLPIGSFAPQKDTWSAKSSLGNAGWDPYPELERESYCGCGPCRCPVSCPCKGACQGVCKCATENYSGPASDYRRLTNSVGAEYAPLQYNVSFQTAMLAPMNRETFVHYSNSSKPVAYQNLESSWAPQKNYQL